MKKQYESPKFESSEFMVAARLCVSGHGSDPSPSPTSCYEPHNFHKPKISFHFPKWGWHW